jgi:hypothetical protein
MKRQLPSSVVKLGGVDAEIDNWSSWAIQDDYYIVPLANTEFQWALFRLSWDDNWSNWGWSADARIAGGIVSYKEAASLMLKALWTAWRIDLLSEENHSYSTILNGLNDSDSQHDSL